MDGIAITGVGLVTPAGGTLESFWQALTQCEDIRTRWQGAGFGIYPPCNVIPVRDDGLTESGQSDPMPQLSVEALGLLVVQRALADAALDATEPRLGCFLSSTTAGVQSFEQSVRRHAAGATGGLDAGHLVGLVGGPFSGPTSMFSTACSSGLLAPSLACDALLADEADAMLAGGLDVLLEYTVCGFSSLRLLSEQSCRPFARDRKGVVLSEGAVCFVFERVDDARRRGARIHGVVLGSGINCDASHATRPDPQGISLAIEEALQRSGIAQRDISAVFSHGTGTQANDRAEVDALRLVFKECALPPLTSIKSSLGHSQAAAGSFSLLAALLAFKHGVVPPMHWTGAVDPALGDIDVVTLRSRPLRTPYLMVNAFGFGGNNAVMMLAREPRTLVEAAT